MSRYFSLCLFLILLIACTGGETKENHNFENYEFHPPIYFYELLEKSKIGYLIDKEQGVFTDLSHTKQSTSISPFAYTNQRKDGSGKLQIQEPYGKILDLYKKAEIMEVERNFPGLIEAYKEALELDDTYFKNWTNVGYGYYLSDDYEKAVEYYQKAIDLNSIGYQEHLYLAAAYYKMAAYEKALKAITYAYMLNRNDEEVLTLLKKILGENNLYLNSERMQFPFKVERVNAKECNIYIDGDEGLRWMGMAYCFAAWEMERKFISLEKKITRQNFVNILKYKEAFLNQSLIISNMIKNNEEVSNKERRLLDAVELGFVDAIILWEIVVPRIPELILVLPEDARETVLQYIQNYVYNDGTMDYGI